MFLHYFGGMHYTLKRNKRAKNVKLHVCRSNGLVITAPLRLRESRIHAIINEKHVWIVNQLNRHKFTPDGLPDYTKRELLPETLHIRLEGKSYDIIYRPTLFQAVPRSRRREKG